MAALSGLFYGPPAGEVDGENEHIRSGVGGFLHHILGQWWLLASAVTGCGESVPVGGDRCPALIDFSKLIRELRLMTGQLPNWKFLLVWSIPFLWVVSQLITAIKG